MSRQKLTVKEMQLLLEELNGSIDFINTFLVHDLKTYDTPVRIKRSDYDNYMLDYIPALNVEVLSHTYRETLVNIEHKIMQMKTPTKNKYIKFKFINLLSCYNKERKTIALNILDYLEVQNKIKVEM